MLLAGSPGSRMRPRTATPPKLLLVNLFGIERPGLTSCPALAEHVLGLQEATP